MKHDIQPRNWLVKRRAWPACLALLLLVFPIYAVAALGDNADSVEADRARLQGNVRIMRYSAHSVHEIQTPYGLVVRQYLSPAGTVFAITWHGPSVPNMRQLLGAYFDRFAQAARVKRMGRAPLVISEPGLVLTLGGHPRSFSGSAYVPGLVPQGVTPEDVR